MSDRNDALPCTRRDALKAVGGAAAATALTGAVSAHADEAEMASAIGHIEGYPEKCSGCRTCMVVCSLSHGDQCGPKKSRIRVRQISSDLFRTSITTCKQCETPMCLYACQTRGAGALHVDEVTGARVIDQERCVGCQSCVQACPQYPDSPIYYDDEAGTCFKCDLCGGDPQCLKYCPMSASWSEHVYPLEKHPLRFIQ